MRLTNKRLSILAIATILAVSNACTLRKRAKAEDEKKDGAKVTVESATPTPSPLDPQNKNTESNGEKPAVPSTNPTDNSSDKGGTPTSAEDQIPASDVQIQLDQEEFNHPSATDQDPGTGETEATTIIGRKRFTGFLNEQGLAYTDSGLDYLVPALRLRQLQAPESKTKSDSLKLAQQISEVRIVNSKGSQALVEVKLINSSNKIITVKLVGPFLQEGKLAKLGPKVNGTLKLVANASIKAELKCLDEKFSNKKCWTYLLKIIQKQEGNEATAQVVIRNSARTIKVRTPEISKKEFRSKELIDAFHRTENENNESSNSHQKRIFDRIDMQSFAVVSGRSGFSIRMMTNLGEHLYFRGPLVSDFGKESVSIPLIHTVDKTDPANASWAPMSSEKLSKWIHSAQLTGNNGRGRLTIELTLSEPSSEKKPTFILKFLPAATPLIDITQDSI